MTGIRPGGAHASPHRRASGEPRPGTHATEPGVAAPGVAAQGVAERGVAAQGASEQQPVGPRGDAQGLLESLANQLSWERKRRRAAEQELAQLLYVVSHDLPEPARMVRGFLQLLDRRLADTLDEDGRQFMGFARDGAERMQVMLAGLLTLSRVESRQKARLPVALRDVVDTAVERNRDALAPLAGTIDVQVNETIAADLVQVREAVSGIIANAIKFRDEGPLDLSIRDVREGRVVRLEIDDSGNGIKSTDRDRAVQVFGRLHPSDEHPGVGLGLAYAARVARCHGGDLQLGDSPLGGLRVILSFADLEDANEFK